MAKPFGPRCQCETHVPTFGVLETKPASGWILTICCDPQLQTESESEHMGHFRTRLRGTHAQQNDEDKVKTRLPVG
ncbi:hypothetical protein EXN66_Car021734 [Channa argus]|uniref:Uncharacterized protein n=1 Tax=Channa argus TaxID=215402 RepID=A0A6G1QUR3_CHAAH|nr:hypothetical protein EXN66_Car021734 [Channa argus]